MNFIWSFEALSVLCMHKNPEVRKWAIGRLSLLYPERTGDIAARLVNDGDPFVAQKSVDHFLQYPPESHKDTLLDTYKKSSGIIAGRIANILAKSGDTRLISTFKEKYTAAPKRDLTGYSLSVLNIAGLNSGESGEIAEGALNAAIEYIECEECGGDIAGILFNANLAAGTDMKSLLNFCFSRPDSPGLIITLLANIGEDCGSWHSGEDIEEEGKKGFLSRDLTYMARESLEYIESHGFIEAGREIKSLFKRERYEEVVEVIFNATDALLRVEKEEHGEDAFYAWENGRGKPRQNISAIAAFRDTVKIAPEGFRGFIARAALSVFARLIEYRGLIGLHACSMDREEILHAFLQERGDVEEDDLFIGALVDSGQGAGHEAGDRDRIKDICVRHITERPDSWANPRIVNLLRRLRDVGAIAEIFRIATGDGRLWEEIVSAAAELGPEALSVVMSVFEAPDEKRVGYALEVLENIPSLESADMIINHWDTLWGMNKEGVLEAVRGIGDRRFIGFLKRELKEGEILEARVFCFLCMINGVTDPQLGKIEREIANHNKRLNQRMEALGSSDIDKLLQEHLQLELKCRGCRRSYHYDVRKIMINIEMNDRYIMDTIRCKNCGVTDHYELTPKALMSMLSHMALLTMRKDAGKEKIDGGVFVFGGYTAIDGKEMSLEEGLRYYEKKVEDNPENPGYLIGYANTLRTAKRTEEAIPHYKNAVIYDPLAIEAYVSLGQIAENKGDHKSAYEYFSKAAGIIHSGNFYRVKSDIDRFKEAVLDNLLCVQEKAGVKPVSLQDTGSAVKRSKVGRNEPCPCGSGMKYKKCCLRKETGQTPAPVAAISSVEERLTDRLMAYSRKERFKREYLNAISLYWRTRSVEPLVLPESASEDRGTFNEWYIIDYLLPSGRTIIEEFYSETFSRLTEEEKAIIEAHMASYVSLYEVQDVTEGVGLRLKDIFTGRETDVREIRGSRSLVRWDIIMARIWTLNGVNRILDPAIQVIPRSFREGLISFLNREFGKFRIETGRDEWSAFMKNRSYIIGHYLEDLPAEERVFLTEERDEVIMARAHFDIRDFEDVLDLFDNEYDFVIDEVADGQMAKLTWLKRGKSKDLKECVEGHEKGMIVQSKLVHESGQLEWTVLGSIHISSRRMVLECLSKERLEWGKKRLMEILRNRITHKADTFEDIERAMEGARTKGEREEDPEPSEKGRMLMDTLLIRQLKEGLDKNIPSLKGMTPREAVKTPEGRGKVMDLIKDLENVEEGKRKEGEPYLDIGVLKRELGLP